MDLSAGTRVGPYEIIGVLGVGGMGAVYRARDTRLRRDVALKFLREDNRDSRRLLHEAQAASALNHPNLCQIYDVGESEYGDWIAMEFVPGERLDRTVPAGGLPPETVVRFADQIAGALAHAHARGIIHRDLKTANCALDAGGDVKVLDFGLAARSLSRIDQDQTQSVSPDAGSVVGTPAYMAPEVIRGQRGDERSDLWALGVIMTELATGGHAFAGSTAYAITSAILTDAPAPLGSSYPDALRAIVSRLLEKDPERRYQSASEVRTALEIARVGRVPANVTPHARAGAGRAALLGAAVIVAAAAAWWWSARDRSLQVSDVELLSTFDGSHGAPALSPAGDMVAFVAADAARVPQVWIKKLDEGNPIQITSGPVPAERPRWHPGGNAVVFARRGQGVWTVPPLGGTPTRIVERGTNPNLSRNGERMTWETPDGIWIAAPDGTGARQLEGVPPRYYSVARSPALSPDGKSIVFFHAEIGPNGDFWVIPSDGGEARRLTQDVREGSTPVWTADGTRIVFSSARAGSRTLWQIPVAGGPPEPLTTGAGEDDAPDLSADGTRLVFTNVRNSWRLVVADPSGLERTLLEKRSELLFPMFSPDGTRITFFGRAERSVAIFTVATDGSNLLQLTGGTELNHQPRWSHDGSEVWFYQVTPEQGLRRVPVIGGPSVQAFPWEWQTHHAAQWAPSGDRIVYTRRASPGTRPTQPDATIVHDIASGRELALPAPALGMPRFSRDGKLIAGVRGDGTVGVCPADGSECRTIAPGGVIVSWAGDDRRLYILRGPANGADQEVWSVALDGSDQRKERSVGSHRGIDRFFDVSIDGKIVFAPSTEGRRELWTAKLR